MNCACAEHHAGLRLMLLLHSSGKRCGCSVERRTSGIPLLTRTFHTTMLTRESKLRMKRSRAAGGSGCCCEGGCCRWNAPTPSAAPAPLGPVAPPAAPRPGSAAAGAADAARCIVGTPTPGAPPEPFVGDSSIRAIAGSRSAWHRYASTRCRSPVMRPGPPPPLPTLPPLPRPPSGRGLALAPVPLPSLVRRAFCVPLASDACATSADLAQPGNLRASLCA